MTALLDAAPSRRQASPWLAVAALAVGGFAIGTTEFATMGVLPLVASDLGVSVPRAGVLISAYALGVVVGAPLLAVLGARVPRRAALLVLMGVIGLGSALSALAPSFGLLVAARFLSGLPHGAYFGLAALVAASLVAPGARGRAVARVMIGLTVANVAGVPLATVLGQQLGWRATYWSVAVLAAKTTDCSSAVDAHALAPCATQEGPGEPVLREDPVLGLQQVHERSHRAARRRSPSCPSSGRHGANASHSDRRAGCGRQQRDRLVVAHDG